MTLSREAVLGVAADVWTSVLELDLVEVATRPEPGRTLTGSVSISGAWQGSVQVLLPALMASRAAALMFATAEADVTPDDVVDALGELTNMIGGNIKSLLPGPSALSLPSVTEGDSYVVRTPGGRLVQDLTLGCEGGLVGVSVWQV